MLVGQPAPAGTGVGEGEVRRAPRCSAEFARQAGSVGREIGERDGLDAFGDEGAGRSEVLEGIVEMHRAVEHEFGEDVGGEDFRQRAEADEGVVVGGSWEPGAVSPYPRRRPGGRARGRGRGRWRRTGGRVQSRARRRIRAAGSRKLGAGGWANAGVPVRRSRGASNRKASRTRRAVLILSSYRRVHRDGPRKKWLRARVVASEVLAEVRSEADSSAALRMTSRGNWPGAAVCDRTKSVLGGRNRGGGSHYLPRR